MAGQVSAGSPYTELCGREDYLHDRKLKLSSNPLISLKLKLLSPWVKAEVESSQ